MASSDSTREALYQLLRANHDLTIAEAAALVGKSPNTAKSWIRRAGGLGCIRGAPDAPSSDTGQRKPAPKPRKRGGASPRKKPAPAKTPIGDVPKDRREVLVRTVDAGAKLMDLTVASLRDKAIQAASMGEPVTLDRDTCQGLASLQRALTGMVQTFPGLAKLAASDGGRDDDATAQRLAERYGIPKPGGKPEA